MLEGQRVVELTGRTFAGCRVRRPIANGRAGVILMAEREATGQPVDVRVLHPYLTHVSGFAQRFADEARAAVGRRHRHVQRVYTFGQADGDAFLALEHLDGDSLRERLARLAPDDTAARLHLAERVLPQIGAGLHALHAQGASHGDLRPSNVFVCADGRVVLLDAGLGRVLYADDVPIMVGAPEYMAPEQAATEAPGDERADQYALTAIAYEILTGRPPYTGPTPGAIFRQQQAGPPLAPSSVTSALPLALDAVVLRGLASDPDARFPDVDALLGALVAALDLTAVPTADASPRVGDTEPAISAVAPEPEPIVPPASVAPVIIAAPVSIPPPLPVTPPPLPPLPPPPVIPPLAATAPPPVAPLPAPPTAAPLRQDAPPVTDPVPLTAMEPADSAPTDGPTADARPLPPVAPVYAPPPLPASAEAATATAAVRPTTPIPPPTEPTPTGPDDAATPRPLTVRTPVPLPPPPGTPPPAPPPLTSSSPTPPATGPEPVVAPRPARVRRPAASRGPSVGRIVGIVLTLLIVAAMMWAVMLILGR